MTIPTDDEKVGPYISRCSYDEPCLLLVSPRLAPLYRRLLKAVPADGAEFDAHVMFDSLWEAMPCCGFSPLSMWHGWGRA